MSEELDDYDDEIEKIFTEINKGINGLKKLNDSDRENKVKYLNGRINRAKDVVRSYKNEMRELDKTVQEPYAKKAKQYVENINKAIQDLNWASDSAALKSGAKKESDADTMTADEILQKADQIQDQSLTSLDRTLGTIEDTKGVASATAAQLAAQTAQLEEIQKGVQEVDVNLKLAAGQLSSFARKLATDKIILGFIILIIGGIVAVIVYSIVNKNSNTNVTSIIPTTTTTG